MNDRIPVKKPATSRKKQAGMSCTEVKNDFEKVLVIAKRARQIVEERRVGFDKDLEELGLESGEDNKERELLAKRYENMQDPVTQAMEEFNKGELIYNYLEED